MADSGERNALHELINCVEKMVGVKYSADQVVWVDTRNYLGMALQEYRTARSEAEPAPKCGCVVILDKGLGLPPRVEYCESHRPAPTDARVCAACGADVRCETGCSIDESWPTEQVGGDAALHEDFIEGLARNMWEFLTEGRETEDNYEIDAGQREYFLGLARNVAKYLNLPARPAQGAEPSTEEKP